MAEFKFIIRAISIIVPAVAYLVLSYLALISWRKDDPEGMWALWLTLHVALLVSAGIIGAVALLLFAWN